MVFKVILYFISASLLTALLPTGEKYSIATLRQLNYWPYQTLKAENDFYQKKTDEELKQEQNKIKSESPLCFKENTSERDHLVNEMEKVIVSGNSDLNPVKLILDSIYQIGVIEKTITKDSSKIIFVVKKGFVEQSTMNNYISINDAIQLIQKRFQKHPEKEKLTEAGLNYLTITVFFDKKLTENVSNENIAAISLYKSSFLKGDILINKNESITNEKREIIISYLQSKELTSQNLFIQTLGRFMVSLMLFGILMLYLAFFRKSIFGQNKQITFIFLIVIVSAIVSRIVSPYGVLFFWSLPFALIAVLVRIFFDSRTALFTFLISILFCSFFANDKFQFVFIQLTIGMGTVFSVAEMRRRKELLFSALVVFSFYLFSFLAFNFASGTQNLLTQKALYLPIIISSLLIIMAYPFVFLAEKVFGFVSDFTLMELCDLNTPLLRELSLKVPGTFQHSLQVANLAEEAIFHIGGNALLVRAGAMYHDIGKMENPRYFTENQVGEINPHNEILPEESAKLIISHVIKGVEKAKEHNLPEAVIDFIRTHHGTTTAGFFLNNFKKEHQGEKINEEAFRYPGPIPFSKETAVLMMADGVEAASRSLKKFDALTINELVDRMIDYKIAENQFINAEITFKDITIVKKIFKKRLMNMYHVRIEYPR